MTSEMKIGTIVEYKVQLADEIGLTFTVIEIEESKNWCKIQANVAMNIKPTYTANITDLKMA